MGFSMVEGYEDPRDVQQVIKEVHHHHGSENGNSKSFDRLKDALLLASILALVGVVWNMSNTVTELKTIVGYLATELKAMQDKK
jgi:hypothetical protein